MKTQIHDLTIVAAVLSASSILYWVATGESLWVTPIAHNDFVEFLRAIVAAGVHGFALLAPWLVTRK